jgi:hypothetical protein
LIKWNLRAFRSWQETNYYRQQLNNKPRTQQQAMMMQQKQERDGVKKRKVAPEKTISAQVALQKRLRGWYIMMSVFFDLKLNVAAPVV